MEEACGTPTEVCVCVPSAPQPAVLGMTSLLSRRAPSTLLSSFRGLLDDFHPVSSGPLAGHPAFLPLHDVSRLSVSHLEHQVARSVPLQL